MPNGILISTDTQTDIRTDRPHHGVCSNRLHLCYAHDWPKKSSDGQDSQHKRHSSFSQITAQGSRTNFYHQCSYSRATSTVEVVAICCTYFAVSFLPFAICRILLTRSVVQNRPNLSTISFLYCLSNSLKI